EDVINNHHQFTFSVAFTLESCELQKDSATLVCLASGGFPSTWSLGWKVGGSSSSSGGVTQPGGPGGGDGHYSWSSTLSISADQWRKAGSVSCVASLSGQSPVTQTLDPDHCSESPLFTYFCRLHSFLLSGLVCMLLSNTDLLHMLLYVLHFSNSKLNILVSLQEKLLIYQKCGINIKHH
uniref:Ig-like domain-containing protein n=1 Tax=Dicentrarchus labrax TaxID=13489 RepID=A0A8P4KF06_DICLA